MAARETPPRFEAAGWLFFVITLGVMLVPGVWWAFHSVRDDTPVIGTIGLGALLAAIAAALITFVVNALLQSFHSRRRRAAQHRKGRK